MLTKSDLQSHLQCRRKLWLEHKRPDLIPAYDTSSHRRAMDGNRVGAYARRQLGEGFIWPPTQKDQETAAAGARRLLEENSGTPAVEVPMLHGEIYARADALVPDGDVYVLRETKASSFPLKSDKITPAAPKEHHVADLAIQAWVMSESGIPMGHAELNLLDNRWRYPGGNDYSGLFRQLDVSDAVRGRLGDVPIWRDEAEKTLAGEMPETMTGKQCSDPYDCPFIDFCKALDPPGPDNPIDLLPGVAGKNLARKLREAHGYTSILDPAPEELTGKHSDLYRRMQEAHRTGQAILMPESAECMLEFAYPRYYFDFEGIDLPVPRWAGVRPYEQIPFQWSCHIERTPGVFEHVEFLDLSGNDPSLACIEHMKDAIDPADGGPIFVYHATYERGRLKELAERHPEHADLLQNYIERLVDLLPLVKAHYYHPDMRGSFSIKKVLPGIAPNLDYGELDEVQEGTGAQIAYLEAALTPETTAARKKELDRKLRVYCGQDTWAMVEIAYFLAQVGRPTRPIGA